jgi:hypothetical protein
MWNTLELNGIARDSLDGHCSILDLIEGVDVILDRRKWIRDGRRNTHIGRLSIVNQGQSRLFDSDLNTVIDDDILPVMLP